MAVKELLKALDSMVPTRMTSIANEASVGDEALLNTLLGNMYNEKLPAQHEVAERWDQKEEVGNEGAAKELLKAMKEKQIGLRVVPKALIQVGIGNEEVGRVLLELLHHEDEVVRGYAAGRLPQVRADNEAVIKALLEALRDEDNWVREQAARSLIQIGAGNEKLVQTLLEALHDEDYQVRARAAESLGQIGAGNEAVVKALLEALQEESNDWVRDHVAESLGQLGAGNEEVVQALLKVLHDDTKGSLYKEWVQLKAANALAQLGTGNEEIARALQWTLFASNGHVHTYGARVLSEIGIGNKGVISASLEALQYNKKVFFNSGRALSFASGWEHAESIRGQAAKVLGQIGVGNEEVARGLLEALQDKKRWARGSVVMSLGRMEIKDTLQLRQLLVALNYCLHDHSDMRQAALKSINQLLDGQPIPGYQWGPLRERRARRLRLRRIAFWLTLTTVLIVIVLAATWLLDTLDLNNFIIRFLAVLSGIFAFIAAVTQVLSLKLRDPWERSRNEFLDI
jgi:HEAT repeat protein